MAAPESLKLREFAARMGWRPSYVTQLKADGRLVLSADGRVLVAESIARIRETADPAKFAVAAHHAAKRGEGTAPASTEAPITPPAPAESDLAENSNYQISRAKREHFLAKAAERDYLISMGQLLPADQVLAALIDAIATLRKGLEAVPDILAPQLAPVTDENTTRSMLADAIEHALEDTARQFTRITETKGETP